jgi:KUP system potassium uptake protein
MSLVLILPHAERLWLTSTKLLAQVMKLSFFPQIKVVHTSEIFHGQLYVPAANILLCIGTVLVASIYNNTTSLGNAYGTCVMFVTFFDTCMVSLVALFVWRLHWYLVILPFLIFISMDGTYLSSALLKVPVGAWFTIMLSGILASLLLLWRFGKEQQWFAEAEDRFPTSHFVSHNPDGSLCLADQFGAIPISTTRGMGIYFDKAGESTPIVFSQFILKLTSIPEVAVFFHLRPLETPHVAPEFRHTVSRLAIPNCYRLVVRYGYNDEIISPDLGAVIYNQVRQYLVAETSQFQHPSEPNNTSTTTPNAAAPDTNELTDEKRASSDVKEDPTVVRHRHHRRSSAHETNNAARLATLDHAFAHRVLYIVGKEQMKIKAATNYARHLLLWCFLWVRDNTRTKMANLKVPAADLIEVGFLKEI